MLRRAALLASSSLSSAGVKSGIIQDDWDTIIEICKAGKAQDFYSIGDAKEVPVNFTYNNVTYTSLKFHIGNFNVDMKSDLSGFVNTSWIASTGIECICAYNNYSDLHLCDQEASTWDTSVVKTTILSSLFEKFPSNLKNNIIEVIKGQTGLPNGYYCSGYTNNKLWIPTFWEMSSLYGSLVNSQWPNYGDFFTSESKYEYYYFFSRDIYREQFSYAVKDGSATRYIYLYGLVLGKVALTPSNYTKTGTRGLIAPCFCL